MFSKNPLINLFRYMWHYSFGSKKIVVFFISFSTIGNLIWLVQPIIIGRVFDSIQFANQKNPLSFIAYNVLIFILLDVVSWFFHGTSRVAENKNAFLVRKNFRLEKFNKVMALPTSWHKNHHSGDTIDKINKASDQLFEFSRELFIIIQNMVKLVASAIILCLYDVKPLVLVIFCAITAVMIILKMDKKLIKNYEAINKAENFISAGVYDYISNYITIISLRLKKQAVDEMDARSMSHFPVSVKSFKLNELKWFSASFIISLMTAGVLFLNAYTSYETKGVIVIGTLFILYQYLDRIGGAFYAFAWKYSDVVRQNTAVMAVEGISTEYEKLHLSEKHYLPKDWKVLQIKKLFFSYKNEEDEQNRKTTLDDVSFNITNGKKIALIGTSGSGKSTVLSLLRGLHRPDSVKVYCDGKKLKKGLRHLEDYCTLIPQEPEIFNNTIEYNITLGVHTDRKQLAEVIELACLSDLIARLEKGLKTSVLEKGVSLSGGEKQRLALARGLLAAKSSQILLLDEPTSSVDVENELKIYQNIFEAFGDKVIISAVHSLHLLRNFDYVYMFKESRLIAEGDFTTLLNDENFKVLWESYSVENEGVKN